MVMVVSVKERSVEKEGKRRKERKVHCLRLCEWWNKVERAINGGWVAWRKGAVCR